jgi:HSP20 family protein
MSQRSGDGLKGLDALNEIGKRLGALADEVKSALNGASEATGGTQSAERSFTVETPAGKLTGVAGYSVRVGGLGGAKARGAAASGPSAAERAEVKRPRQPDVDGAREPLIDMYDESAELLVTVELPGVAAGEITVQIEDDVLLIATSGSRRYRSRVDLPCSVQAERMVHALRNGILEVRLPKTSAAEGEVR